MLKSIINVLFFQLPNLSRRNSSGTKRTFRLLFIFHFSFFIFTCGLDIEDPTPPSPPVWVQKSLPEEWPERGIDAHESGGIHLEWEPNSEENIGAYLIFRAEYFEQIDSTGELVLLFKLKSEPNTPLEYLDADVSIRMKYSYQLKAEDLSASQSLFSEAQEYKLLPSIPIGHMMPNGNNESLGVEKQLKWTYWYTSELEDYCLTLLTWSNDLIWREYFKPGNYVGGLDSRRIPESVILSDGQIYKWRIDTGANYVNGNETTGSESPWATFLYNSE